MKRILLILALLAGSSLALCAQDSTAVAAMDSTLIGKSIFSLMGPNIQVTQSKTVSSALTSHIRNNASRNLTGYRIRVFYDSGSTARTRSEAIERALRAQYSVGVYRSFESPNYKVSVGDFRTKDEALRIYNLLKGSYPTAYIIKETINYPR
ncbi:MAG: SPOR domain-containing protein [Bacteroidales bacterium]|nr:SPOR domain-containing protein [Bacteroidales bacterium]